MLAFSTGAMLFPSLFTAEAFSTSNIAGPFASILSPQIAEFKRPIPLIVLICVACNSILMAFFLTVPDDKESLAHEVIEMKIIGQEKLNKKAALLKDSEVRLLKS